VVWLFLASDLQDIRNTNWLVRSQWIDPDLNPQMRPIKLSASEYVDSIAVVWNEYYKGLKSFYGKHSVDKGEVLAKLEPLVKRATETGSQIAGWFDAFERDELDEQTLLSRVRAVSSEIYAITDQLVNMPFPPQDVEDYYTRAQSLFGHLGNMALYYSDRGIETWPEKNRTVLMSFTVRDFRADLQRLEFEREKLH